MADPTQFEWTEKALDLAHAVAMALITAASGVVLWFGRQANLHIRMLRRHEERLDENDKELGFNREHRATCGKAPMGEALNTTLEDLRKTDQKLHSRINTRRAEIAAIREEYREMKADIKWLCREWGRPEDCDTNER